MQSYRPKYHASVPKGWSNDPNGTVFYKGKAHLFYQHYPHKAEWGTMHWGHFTTDQPERQRQCIAISQDGGIHFSKSKDNPILTSEMLSPEVTETDCRDPRLFQKDGMYYFIAGARVLTKEELDAVFRNSSQEWVMRICARPLQDRSREKR